MPLSLYNLRGLRSGSTAPASSEPSKPSPVSPPSPITFHPTPSPPPQNQILILPPTSTTSLPHISPTDLKLLRKKQSKLRLTAPSTLSSTLSVSSPDIRNALNATLIFAQHEAGTAVLIHASGWALTCAHCFGEDEEEYKAGSKRRWMLFYTGDAVLVECRAWDAVRDLALLRIVAVESHVAGPIIGKKEISTPSFHAVDMYAGTMRYKMRILCIGQPGRDDLESKECKKTTYDLVEVSQGAFRGMVQGVDVQDNGEIGTLMHDAWTYWGHSGAPLVREADGKLVGLHSSWDDATGMRHGVPVVAIREFLLEHLPVAVGGMTKSTAVDVDAL
ncbi:hypothetical protein LOCC1_G004691 [Lachnellula occidentalis]|uniref:Serine protease n=1 Tax=Lachnellula occidentalis TaxID=215460 RepID=A0A8H8RXM2_9HELO|nr:hypothetical protein LOCC1_G004691 [Lachnellula occidentalis]